jgi:hypothetical protein
MSRNAWVGQHPGKEDSRLARISPYLFGAHGLSNINYLPKLRDLPCCGLDFKAIVFDFGFNPGSQSIPATGAAKLMIGVDRPLLIWGISAISTVDSSAPGAPQVWSAGTTYGLGANVLRWEQDVIHGPFPFPPGGIMVWEGWLPYTSLQAGNTGNDPLTSPTWWKSGSSPFDAGASSGFHFQFLHSHQGNQRQFFSKFMTPTESGGSGGLPLLLKTPYMVIRGDELTCQVRNVQVTPVALQVQVVLYGGEFD